jgi:hypothetical protein
MALQEEGDGPMDILFSLIGIILGIIISPFLFIWLFTVFGYIWLRIVGIHVKATVTQIEPYPHGYRLFAQWQDPKTGQTYTFRTSIKKPDKYPVGSSIPVVFNPKKPTWRLMALFD